MGVEPPSETSYGSDMHQAMGNAKHSSGVTNTSLSIKFGELYPRALCYATSITYRLFSSISGSSVFKLSFHSMHKMKAQCGGRI